MQLDYSVMTLISFVHADFLVSVTPLLLLLFVVQTSLKATEYHMEGGSDMFLQLFHGGQVQGEGGTRVASEPGPGKMSCYTCGVETII